MDVKYAKGLLSVKAEKADLVELLKRIAKAAGLTLDVGSGVSGNVTVSFAGMKLEAGIARVLESAGEKNLATEYTKKPGAKKDEFTIEKISVVKKASPQEEAAARERMMQEEREYREFADAMNKAGNKIARALKQYQDPGASKNTKVNLLTYLRTTGVTDPNDKKVLKGALLDPQYQQEIVAAIQMALLHAIQRNPEESDKEYLLHVLQRDDNRVGWLYYALLNAWDERYVPLLMEQAEKKRSLSSIEILGRRKITAAIPIMEDILRTSKMYSPEMTAALNAMTHLTGKRANIWNYRGRNGEVLERKEEAK